MIAVLLGAYMGDIGVGRTESQLVLSTADPPSCWLADYC